MKIMEAIKMLGMKLGKPTTLSKIQPNLSRKGQNHLSRHLKRYSDADVKLMNLNSLDISTWSNFFVEVK